MPLYVNGKYKVYEVHNYVDEFLRFGIFPPHISDSCGATYRRNYETFSALLSTSGPLTNSEKTNLVAPFTDGSAKCLVPYKAHPVL